MNNRIRTASQSIAAPSSCAVIELLEGRRLLSDAALVANINHEPQIERDHPLIVINGRVIMDVELGLSRGLWASEGTTTTRLLDATDGELGGVAAIFGGKAYFTFDPIMGQTQLWKTDGTVAGTEMVIDLGQSPPLGGADLVQDMTPTTKRLFFTVGDNPSTLWATDGTAAGTANLHRFSGTGAFVLGQSRTARPKMIARNGGGVYFSADESDASIGVKPRQLWRSNGTKSTTASITTFRDEMVFTWDTFKPEELTAWRGSALFVNDALVRDTGGIEHHYEDVLWLNDGAQSRGSYFTDTDGTPLRGVRDLAVAGDRAFFDGWYGGKHGLWSIADLGAAPKLVEADGGVFVGAIGGRLLYTAGGRLKANSGGTSALLGEFPSVLGFSTASEGLAYFTTGKQLWRTDGTAAGTKLVKTFSAQPKEVRGQSDGSAIFYVAGVLYRSTGTSGSTAPVMTVLSTQDGPSDPDQITDVNGTAYFVADDGVHGREVWRADPAGGAQLLLDLRPGAAGSRPTHLLNVDGRLFFEASDADEVRHIYMSDGTAAGTLQVPLSCDVVPGAEMAAYRGAVYFRGRDAVHGEELWRTDGTASGTYLVADVAAGTADTTAHSFVVFDDLLFYVGSAWYADDQELWCTDGTDAGTRRYVETEGTDADISNLTIADGQLFFAASTPTYGRELWVTNGDPASTRIVKDFTSGADSTDFGDVEGVGDQVYFTAVRDGYFPKSLYRTDGSADGTKLVAALQAGELTNANGTLYFVASTNETNGSALWTTDGTPAGTRYLRQQAGLYSGALPQHLTAIGSTLYFSAVTAERGAELWRTAGATGVVVELMPGVFNTKPQNLAVVGGALMFAADDGEHGNELWRAAPPPGSIVGTVFNDANVDLVRGGSEKALVNCLVWIDSNGDGILSTGERSARSSSTGRFRFDDLAAGRYLLCVEPLDGTRIMSPTAYSVKVSSGNTASRTFALTTSSRIAGIVYMDANKSGTRDGGEAGLGGWRIFLDSNHNGVQDAGEIGKSTKADGRFVFEGLAPGEYTVRVIGQDGYRGTYPRSNAFTLTTDAAGTYTKRFGQKHLV